MFPDSLRARLTLALALVLAAFLGLAGLALDRAFQRSVEAGRAPAAAGHSLPAARGRGARRRGRAAHARALAAPRLGTPDSGLYAAIRGGDGAILWRSGSSLGRAIDYPAAGAPGEPAYARVPGAGGATLHALAYPVTLGARRRQHAPPRVPGRGRRRRRRGPRGRLPARAVGLVSPASRRCCWWRRRWCCAGAWGRCGARRARGRRDRGGRARASGRQYPRELRPLTDNLNALIAGSAARLQRYRDALADLAHSLKTPLAVLRAVDDADAEAGTVREQAERMERAVDWHLQRAAAAGGSGLVRAVAVADVLARLEASLAKVHAGRAVALEPDVPPGTTFRGDPEDFMEIAGNLLDNAWKRCAGRVRVQAAADGGRLTLVVEDDGPGLPAARRREALRAARAPTRACRARASGSTSCAAWSRTPTPARSSWMPRTSAACACASRCRRARRARRDLCRRRPAVTAPSAPPHPGAAHAEVAFELRRERARVGARRCPRQHDAVPALPVDGGALDRHGEAGLAVARPRVARAVGVAQRVEHGDPLAVGGERAPLRQRLGLAGELPDGLGDRDPGLRRPVLRLDVGRAGLVEARGAIAAGGADLASSSTTKSRSAVALPQMSVPRMPAVTAPTLMSMRRLRCASTLPVVKREAPRTTSTRPSKKPPSSAAGSSRDSATRASGPSLTSLPSSSPRRTRARSPV
ncbi:MAG: hypothetical protein U5K43_07630 [Halofilum sp. (in: g-proteobacteria)]|nr:hypothetical protein [Halofilum sp. (in: g-proteobacteria)]